jgi:hypothetical protein
MGIGLARGRDWTADYLKVVGKGSYRNASDKPWQIVVLSGTQRIQTGISERGAAIC